MALATYRVLANEYDAEADAIADYEAIRKLYRDLGILDSLDAAVITRQPDGKIIIVKRVDEQPEGKRRWVAGLAVGTAVALFPAVALGIPVAGLGMGLLAGAGVGRRRRWTCLTRHAAVRSEGLGRVARPRNKWSVGCHHKRY